MWTDRAEIRTITEQATAVRRATVAPAELTEWLPAAFRQIAAYLHHQGIAPKGFPFARYHVRPDGLVDVEAGFPVAAAVAGDGSVQPSSLPGGHAVAVRHAGPADKLELAYQAIDEWLRAERAEPLGDPWEVHHDPPTADQLHTEIVQPIKCSAGCS